MTRWSSKTYRPHHAVEPDGKIPPELAGFPGAETGGRRRHGLQRPRGRGRAIESQGKKRSRETGPANTRSGLPCCRRSSRAADVGIDRAGRGRERSRRERGYALRAAVVRLARGPPPGFRHRADPRRGRGASRPPIVLFQYSPNNPFYYRPEVLARICREIPQVQAIKMATNVDVAQYEEEVRAVRAVPRKVFLLPANGRTLYYAFQLLPDGALSGSANFCPAHDVEMFEAVKRGDLKRAKELHDEIFPIFRLVYRDPYVFLHIRYKYCAWLLGKISSPALRSPLVPPARGQIIRAQEGLRSAGREPVHYRPRGNSVFYIDTRDSRALSSLAL